MLTWQKDFFQVSLFGKYVSRIYTGSNFNSDIIEADQYVGDYNLLNLYFGFRIGDFTLSVKLNNLLDKNYDYLPGFKAPGISILTGIEYAL
jgi:outer membrane cobalamin receptor